MITSLDEMKEVFSHPEFSISPPMSYSVKLEQGWSDGEGKFDDLSEPLDGVQLVSGDNEPLIPTAEALFALAGVLGIGKDLLTETPADAIAPVFNYWLAQAEEDKGPQFLVSDEVAVSLVHSYNLLPLSMVEVIERVANALVEQGYVDGLEDISGGALHQDAALSQAVVLIPEAGDGWRTGVHISYSVSGRSNLVLSMVAYHEGTKDIVLFDRWTFKHSPKKHGKTWDLLAEWVDQSVSLIGLEMADEWDDLMQLQGVEVDEDELTKVVADLFSAVRMPMSLRALVADAAEHVDELSGYTLMQCFAGAQHAPGVKVAQRERVQRAAGMVREVLGSRCQTCHSLLAENIEHEH